MKKLYYAIRSSNLFCYIEGIIIGYWFVITILRNSYNELVNKAQSMPDYKRETFELCLWAYVYDESSDEKTQANCDALIQMTLGLNNWISLYNYVKEYNETHRKEAA